LLELASELSNVSRACKLIGCSRQQFYEIRRNFQTYGADGLIDRLPGAKGLTRTAFRPRLRPRTTASISARKRSRRVCL
jgi:hypothetical protein